MSRRLALAALLSLAASAAVAAPPSSYRYTYKGDGFDAQLWSYDGCREIGLYLRGADQFWKSGPGAPATNNYVGADAWIYDYCSQSYGWAWLDLTGAVLNARGVNATTTLVGSMDIPVGHWEEGTVEECYSWEEQCYDDNWNPCDCAGECAFEYPAGSYCYFPWVWVDDGARTMAFNLTMTPEGSAWRGMNMYSGKSKTGMYRYRYNGTNRSATLSGTWVLDGQDLLGSAGSWANVWNTNGGEVSIWRY